MDVGTTLRIARERRGLTLAQLATRTKIPMGMLQALEENAFERVPRGIFARGFLRAYAGEVGLDPAEIVDQFRTETGDVASTAGDTPAPDGARIQEELEPSEIDPDLTASGPGWGYVLIVSALLVALISFNRSNTPDQPDGDALAAAADAAAAAPQPVPAAVVHPVATAGQDLPALGATSPLSTLRFDIEAQAPCWVEAVVDGRRIVYRLMQPGERHTIESAREIILRIGDPGAFSYSINGTPGQPVGRPGIPITVRFTNEGHRPALVS